jgi:arsenate reductase
MIQIFGYPKCKATRAAQRFFSDRKMRVQDVDLREQSLSKGELQAVAQALGGVAALWDPESKRVRELGLQHIEPTDDRLFELFLEDGLLCRTPIVRLGDQATVGKDPAGWKALFEQANNGGTA